MGMHRCLQHLLECLALQSLASPTLTIVCKMFEDTALNVLWYEQMGLQHMLNCIYDWPSCWNYESALAQRRGAR
ncbi:hypothetical protein B0H17DRAFT_1083025 [Mycena rosella]|uniref:Secreted protein n=1 Tax=Mycena rosella TaxID=1033263 RepID=A0AAD7G6U8_MYCRO|nr:hypothetical protein B0H17DRAFT_1083025 [Mycena rosella]